MSLNLNCVGMEFANTVRLARVIKVALSRKSIVSLLKLAVLLNGYCEGERTLSCSVGNYLYCSSGRVFMHFATSYLRLLHESWPIRSVGARELMEQRNLCSFILFFVASERANFLRCLSASQPACDYSLRAPSATATATTSQPASRQSFACKL